MGFFDHLKTAFLGETKPDPVLGSIPKGATKESLVRDMIKRRIRTENLQVNPAQVDDLPLEAVMALPEATIFTIVEVFCGLRARGYDTEKAILFIEQMRESAGKANLPKSPTLANLIICRLEVEHPGDPVANQHALEVIRQAFVWFSQS